MTEKTPTEVITWKALEYAAGRRSSAELETYLRAFIAFCRTQGWHDLAALHHLLMADDDVLRGAMRTGQLPPGFAPEIATLWTTFHRLWPAQVDLTEREPSGRRRPFQDGEWVVLVDRKGRSYLTRLEPGKNFTFHLGAVAMDAIIGQREGVAVRTTRGESLLVFRPTLRDYLLHMPRHAQVVYPKDSAIMAMWGDLFPGARVLESGLGSGALAMVILRMIGPDGVLVSYEIRKDFIRRAQRNITRWLGTLPDNHKIHNEDIQQARVEPESFDRVFLDLPTPTVGLAPATAALRPGGILVSLSPTVPQVQQTVEWLRASHLYACIEVIEVLLRPWNIRGHSVRPAHRMVAHTAFIVVARRILPGQQFVDDTYI